MQAILLATFICAILLAGLGTLIIGLSSRRQYLTQPRLLQGTTVTPTTNNSLRGLLMLALPHSGVQHNYIGLQLLFAYSITYPDPVFCAGQPTEDMEIASKLFNIPFKNFSHLSDGIISALKPDAIFTSSLNENAFKKYPSVAHLPKVCIGHGPPHGVEVLRHPFKGICVPHLGRLWPGQKRLGGAEEQFGTRYIAVGHGKPWISRLLRTHRPVHPLVAAGGHDAAVPVWLYAPTWRGKSGDSGDAPSTAWLSVITKLAIEDSINLILGVHVMQQQYNPPAHKRIFRVGYGAGEHFDDISRFMPHVDLIFGDNSGSLSDWAGVASHVPGALLLDSKTPVTVCGKELELPILTEKHRNLSVEQFTAECRKMNPRTAKHWGDPGQYQESITAGAAEARRQILRMLST